MRSVSSSWKLLTSFFQEEVIPFLKQRRTSIFVFVGVIGLLFILVALLTFQYQSNVRAQNLAQEELNSHLPAWERKDETNQELRVAVIAEMRFELEDNYTFASDIEDRYYAVEKFMKPLVFFRSQMEKYKPDYIVNLGSSIVGNDQDQEVGMDALQFARAQLEKLSAPLVWVIGNRDMRSMTRIDYQEVTDAPSAPYKIDNGDYRLIVLDTNYDDSGLPYDKDTKEYGRGSLDQEQLLWLEEELKTSKHVYIFMHHGAFDQSVPIAGKDSGKEKSINNAQEFRALVSKYKVDAVFVGHLKAYAYESTDGVEYFSAEDLRDYGHHPGAFYEMTISSGVPSVKLYHIDRDDEKLDSQDYIKDALKIFPEQENSEESN